MFFVIIIILLLYLSLVANYCLCNYYYFIIILLLYLSLVANYCGACTIYSVSLTHVPLHILHKHFLEKKNEGIFMAPVCHIA